MMLALNFVRQVMAPLGVQFKLGANPMDRDFHEKSYREITNLALAGYQLIEARLKSYLNDYFEIVKYKVGNELHFGFNGDDYKTAALSTLLKIFSKTCADTSLIKQLQAEVPHRDHVAHQALLTTYRRTPCSTEELSQLADELANRAKATSELLERLSIIHASLVAPYKNRDTTGA